MKNILLTTDFSKNSRNAAIYAINLFGNEEIKYTFLNALDSKVSFDLMTTKKEDLKIASLIELNNEITYLKDYFPALNLTIEPCFKMDSITNSIDYLNDKESYDFIVTGTKGENSKSWFLGSTAKKITQHSPVPVLIIPEMATFKKISTILFVTDLRLDESYLINQAISFAKFNNASMTILHVDRDGSASNWSLLKLKELVKNSDYDQIKFEKLVDDDVEKAIIRYILNNNVDLLSVITYTTTLFKKWFHHSLTKKLLKHSKIPLLVYNRKEFDIIFLG
ncbi:MAG: hypothetical protein RI883_366 [Bacteroidota bacterium]|jgi:nucleotide-binding universal stress UspA family protein